MAVDRAPQRRDAVDVLVARDVVVRGAVRAGDDREVLPAPSAVLREGVPEDAAVEVLELAGGHGGQAREGCGRNAGTATACDGTAADVRQNCKIAAAPAPRPPALSYPRRVPARRIQLVAAVVGA